MIEKIINNSGKNSGANDNEKSYGESKISQGIVSQNVASQNITSQNMVKQNVSSQKARQNKTVQKKANQNTAEQSSAMRQSNSLSNDRYKSNTKENGNKPRSYNSDGEEDLESILKDLNYPASKRMVAQKPVLTQQRLQEAVIWSEILGEPKCRRRKRR
jgi:hypothetical protein